MFKPLHLIVAAALSVLLLSPLAEAAGKKSATKRLAQVCKTVVGLNFLIKGELSSHITNPGSRANSITVVCTRKTNGCPTPLKQGKKVDFYYCDGSKAGSVGRYYPNFSGNGQARAYCGSGGASSCNMRTLGTKMKQVARKEKCSKKFNDMYMVVDPAKKTCVTFVPTARNGGL